MKRIRPFAALAALSLLLGAAAPAAAETSATLGIGIKADRGEFVRGERITLSGVVRNAGSSILIVDDYGAYTQNVVRLYLRDAATGRLLLPRAGAPRSAVPSLTVKPGESKPFTIDVGTLYDLPAGARLQATAVVERGSENAASRPAAFTLVEGIEFTAKTATLPGDDSRLYRFALLYWARDQVENIFLRVTEPGRDNRIAGFVSLGNVVRVAEPTLSIDARGVVTIVQQISRDRFARTRIDATEFPLHVMERNENLLSADAVSERITLGLVSERVAAQEAEKKEESRGLFSRHRTRTPADDKLPSAITPRNDQ